MLIKFFPIIEWILKKLLRNDDSSVRGGEKMKGNIYQASVMSQISHELRIPLTGIMGMARFLSETSLTAQQKDYLKIIQVSAERLLSLEDKLHLLLKQKK